jgi:hypothetical protein
MSTSTTPAKNETVPYGALLAQSSKLKRSDQVLLVKALAGQLGMIAMFPGQLPAMQGGVAASPAKAGRAAKGKSPAKQEPTNPLSGSPEKKAFDAAKKAVSKATKEAGNKLPDSHELVVELNRAKDQYFRSLSSAKGSEVKDPSGSKGRFSSENKPSGSASNAGSPARQAAKPSADLISKNANGKFIWKDGQKWRFVTSEQELAWGL